ncbi:hypothetical protein Ddye_014734 [Dipteronia dyeriana]|uniref:DUF1985 domain-containing protein n=1 Tax=Dipteronia dyeriana TaxID=168575 RepID=A0AAD9X9D8_9ROSI|nr:hypothetical protein Ddye_014734 [Dipteronia dyeriana]
MTTTMTRQRYRHNDDVQMRETRSEDETPQMSGDESRRLRQTSGADDDHHEEPPKTTWRPTRRRHAVTSGLHLLFKFDFRKENIDYDQFLKVQKNKWTQEALINVGCQLKYISNIEDILCKKGKHADFMASCFKQFGQFPTNWLFSTQIVHSLLLREIQIDGASENELWFSVGGKKMALFLIANNVLFGQPFDKKVTPWLFNLVDDLEAFNGLAWGHYVFKMTLHYLRHDFRSRNSKKGYGKVRYRLYGFPWAVEVWAMEVVDNLLDGFGMRLQDTLPRMRRWTMHKKPYNFMQTILDLEASIRSENVG